MTTDDEVVWLGTPQRLPYSEDVRDPLTAKIGGKAVYFRAPASSSKAGEPASASTPAVPSAFACPKCRSAEHVALLSQLFAPLEPFDRVLYVLMCLHCTQPSKPLALSRGAPPSPAVSQTTAPSVCFAVRSENFNKRSFQTMMARHAQEEARKLAAAQPRAKEGGALFEENMDWGDGGGADDWGAGADDWGDDDDGLAAPAPAPASTATAVCAPVPPPCDEQEEYPLAPIGQVIPLRAKTFTDGIPLDLFEEPDDPYKKKKTVSLEQQLEELEARYGDDVIEAGSAEKDDETPQEKFVRKYMARLEREPSQCVRWSPGGHALCTSTQTPALAARPPACARCGAARHFELQLTAPVVYFLTKEDGGEKHNQFMRFSNIHVFTCTANCSGPEGYTREHVLVEEEI